ncbi:MAG: hypothetical protein WBG86_04870 [Polyangiales bacterium]
MFGFVLLEASQIARAQDTQQDPAADQTETGTGTEPRGYGQTAETPSAELGDRRFRLVVLGRFGVGGKVKVATVDLLMIEGSTIEAKANTTFGLDLRFEKPIHRNVTIGGVLGSYWIGSNDPDYALDVSALVKQRYVFRAGRKEAEVYLAVQFGGSLLVNRVYTFSQGGGMESSATLRNPSGGFNVGIAPGFQVFVTHHVAVVLEVGYGYSWFRIKGGPLLDKLTLGQATIRTGFSLAF